MRGGVQRLDDLSGECLEVARLRKVMKQPSTTTSLSCHLAPALIMSVLMDL